MVKLVSAVSCQGQFSINLIGTGLKVAEATKWTSQGNYVSVKVHRSEVTMSGLSFMWLGKTDFFFLGGECSHLNRRAVLLPDSLKRNLRWHFYTFHSLRNKAALFPLSPLSFVLACRTGQESTAAVAVSVGSAFPRLTTVSSCKCTEIQAQSKPRPALRCRTPATWALKGHLKSIIHRKVPSWLRAAKGYVYLHSGLQNHSSVLHPNCRRSRLISCWQWSKQLKVLVHLMLKSVFYTSHKGYFEAEGKEHNCTFHKSQSTQKGYIYGI